MPMKAIMAGTSSSSHKWVRAAGCCQLLCLFLRTHTRPFELATVLVGDRGRFEDLEAEVLSGTWWEEDADADSWRLVASFCILYAASKLKNSFAAGLRAAFAANAQVDAGVFGAQRSAK